MRPICRVVGVICLLLSCGALAQSGKVFFTNAGPYTEAELLKVTGIATGQTITDDAISQGAQRLVDTGLFDDAAATYNGQGAQRQVRYTLKPTPAAALFPVSFANVVWYSPQELDTELRQRVPLYRGRISEAGNMGESVTAALQAMLADKGVTAKVEHTSVAATLAHPQRVIDFKVAQPYVVIASASYTGDTGATLSAPDRQAVAAYLANLKGLPYNEGLTDDDISDQLLAPWRNLGYVKAKLEAPSRSVVPAARGVGVAFMAQLTAGAPYTMKAIGWEPTEAYSAADFARDAKLHAGQPAAANLLLETEAPILKAYRARGYMDAVIESGLATDDIAHTVSYTLHATPGEIYHLQSLSVVGLPPEVQAEFDAAWSMKAGDVYDEPYINKFIQNNTAMRKLSAYAGGYQASADPQKHTVDLTLTFTRFR
jgi:outer membrane protein insertion porin family